MGEANRIIVPIISDQAGKLKAIAEAVALLRSAGLLVTLAVRSKHELDTHSHPCNKENADIGRRELGRKAVQNRYVTTAVFESNGRMQKEFADQCVVDPDGYRIMALTVLDQRRFNELGFATDLSKIAASLAFQK